MMRSFLTLLLLVPVTGCAAFLIQPEDSTAMKAAKVAARVPLALVSLGESEVVYYCARGLDAPPVLFAVDAEEEDAVPGQPEGSAPGQDSPEGGSSWSEAGLEAWARLMPEERLDTCWGQFLADQAASNSAFSNSVQQPAWSKDAKHHRKGHKHHHRHGC